jgi:bifunctional UDP-N-acetylglucosamine pyrophosphorylase/glucosamine-1-phosphate N-acetyltransferase
MNFSVIILAAGEGKRMRSALPKVLQPLAGRALLARVLDSALALEPATVHVVYGHGGDQVRAQFADWDLDWAEQAEQLGTGHAVQQALPAIPADHQVLVLCGDVPLITESVLRDLLAAGGSDRLALLTAELDDPTGYGRILRDADGNVTAIVEERDADEAQRAVREINTGLMACPAVLLTELLAQVRSDNSQGEYYLTDIVGLAVAAGHSVAAARAPRAEEVLGINDKRQLAEAEALLRARITDELMDTGVTLIDPSRVDVRGRLSCGRDVFIDVNAVFIGDVELADGVHVGPNTVIRDSVIGAGTRVHPNCVIEEAYMGANCEIGPYARVRPGVEVDEGGKLGNFVELKKTRLGKGSKVNHLSYVGDAIIGDAVNVGAGTITCNYDGANKHQTIIGDRAFIGSGTQLVAPVEIGLGATIGAGSVISKDAPAEQLTLARGRQVTIAGWQRPVKKK